MHAAAPFAYIDDAFVQNSSIVLFERDGFLQRRMRHMSTIQFGFQLEYFHFEGFLL